MDFGARPLRGVITAMGGMLKRALPGIGLKSLYYRSQDRSLKAIVQRIMRRMKTSYDLDSWVRQWLLSGNRMTGDEMERLSVRLANWRAWLRRSPQYGQCGSLEGNFRSPQIWYPPGPRPPEPGFADAWDITLAAATLQIRLHLVLKLRHVIQFSDKVIAEILRRELKFRAKAIDVDHIDWEAKLALLDALGTPQVARRQRAVDRTRQIIKRTEDLMLD